ncbi:hypothetical protein AVEN_56194-1 [Araneus ventricosus]|uniref:Uncharacterized protein n=1 Tax=Araneus ventricosus TaxID=182803 RepID=A0A4Y2UG58_ARAVE|nr:hypothetical protein AVEN_56194-1 [Araneus ventricosus]
MRQFVGKWWLSSSTTSTRVCCDDVKPQESDEGSSITKERGNGDIMIQFLIGENVPSSKTHHRLQQQYWEECLSWIRAFERCKGCREGKENVKNDRQPRTSVSGPNNRSFGSGYVADQKTFL